MEPKDERFVESFRYYMELLVEESVHEINGWTPIPTEKFEETANCLVEDAEVIGLSDDAKKLAEQVNALASYRMLAPEPGTSSPEGVSILNVVKAAKNFRDYFESAGLELSAGESGFNGRPIVEVCLGEAKIIDVEPKVVIFTKTIVGGTCNAIAGSMGLRGRVRSWTDHERSYHLLEPKLEDGRKLYDELQSRASAKVSLAEVGKVTALQDRDKLEELAWSPLLWECKGDKESFARKYSMADIENDYPHEIYHKLFAKNKSGSWIEAAAQLHSMQSQFANPFGVLNVLYGWGGIGEGKYSHAAEIAFRQLELAGYDKSIWEKLEPEDVRALSIPMSAKPIGSHEGFGEVWNGHRPVNQNPHVDEAAGKLRELAGKALLEIESILEIERPPEIEKKLGESYQKLHGELQTLWGGAKYGT